MREEKPHWQRGVILVCTNERPPGAAKPSCGQERGALLRHRLKTTLREQGGPGSECRVLATSCLNNCPEDGVAVAMVPGEQVYIVDPESESTELIQQLQQDAEKLEPGRRILSRLRRRLS